MVDILGRYTQGGHLVALHHHIDGFLALTVQGNALDVLGLEQLALQHLGVVVQLPGTVALPSDRVIHPVDVAEVVVDQRIAGPRREISLVITYLATQFVPDLGQGEFVVFVHHVGLDPGEPPRGIGFDPLELPHLLDRLFDHIRDLLFHLLGSGPGIGSEDDSLLDGKLGIFETAEGLIRFPADHHREYHHHPGDQALANAPFRQIHPLLLPQHAGLKGTNGHALA